MKRVLSLGDIACDESEDVDGENGVLTQLRSRRGANKSKKTKTKNSTTASNQSKDTSSTISSAINPESVVSEDQVNKLLATINEQKAQIQNLTQKLDFVLSFLGINDASLVATNDSTSDALANASTATTTATSTTYADVALAAVNRAAPIQIASSRPVSFHEAVVAAVHVDQRARERRAKSVVVSGLATDTGSSDTATFRRLCASEFGFDAEVTYTRRLGNVIDGRIQPLLVCFQSAEVANELVKNAKLLRNSVHAAVRENVYINHNLTKTEARLAYEERCRRRQRLSQATDGDVQNHQHTVRVVVNSNRKRQNDHLQSGIRTEVNQQTPAITTVGLLPRSTPPLRVDAPVFQQSDSVASPVPMA